MRNDPQAPVETGPHPNPPVDQMESLRRFAQDLFDRTVENPPSVIELLNRYFWELV